VSSSRESWTLTLSRKLSLILWYSHPNSSKPIDCSSIRIFQRLAIKDIDEQHSFLTVEDFISASLFHHTDSKLQGLKGSFALELILLNDQIIFFFPTHSGAPALEMGLLVAMKILEEDKREEYNFEVVYDQFNKFARDEFMNVSKSTAFVVRRNVLLGEIISLIGLGLQAFQSLLEQELIKRVARRSEENATPIEYLMVRLMPTPSQIEEVLKDKVYLLLLLLCSFSTGTNN